MGLGCIKPPLKIKKKNEIIVKKKKMCYIYNVFIIFLQQIIGDKLLLVLI